MSTTVFLTRPAGRNEAIAKHLRSAGLEVEIAPALSITALAAPQLALQPGDLAVFVSRQAVAFFQAAARAQNIAGWPPGAWAGAVGSATGAALAALVPQSGLILPANDSASDSEAFLAALDARRVAPANAHIMRAQTGRDWLAQRLEERAWRVFKHALYRRAPNIWSAAQCDLLANSKNPIILVSSLESFQAMQASMQRSARAWPKAIGIVTLHERIAARLQYHASSTAAGAWRISVCQPTDSAITQAILALAANP